MATVTLIEAVAADANGNPVSVKMAGGGSRGYDHKGSTDWLAGVAGRPKRRASIGFDETGPLGRSAPGQLEMVYSAASTSRISRIGKLAWAGARIVVSTGDDAAAAPLFTPAIVGTVTDFAVDGADAHITITDLSAELDVAVATASFAGSGGLEGDDAATGRVKRRSWGRVFNVEGRVLVAASNVYEFGDPAWPLLGFVDVRDIGRSGVAPVIVGWQGSMQATLNALVATAPPPGGGAYAPSIACVRWYTQPVGPLTADIVASAAGLGDIAAAIASIAADIVIPNAEVANLVAARAGDCGIHLDDASTTAANLLDQLLLGASSLWTVDPDGTLRLRPWSFDAPVAALPCQQIARTELLPPLLSRKLGFQRNWRVQSAGELAADVSSADVYYQNGTPIEVLKPMEAGANVTEARVSAAIAGQGGLATKSAVDFSSGDVANRLAAYLLYGTGGVTVQSLKPAEPGSNVTEARVAAAFYGQGALATRSTVDFTSGDVQNKNADYLYYNVGQGGYTSSVGYFRPQEPQSNVTETRTSSAIAGQGALATQSQATGFVCYSDSNTYTGSGGPSTGTAGGGSGGGVNRGGSIP